MRKRHFFVVLLVLCGTLYFLTHIRLIRESIGKNESSEMSVPVDVEYDNVVQSGPPIVEDPYEEEEEEEYDGFLPYLDEVHPPPVESEELTTSPPAKPPPVIIRRNPIKREKVIPLDLPQRSPEERRVWFLRCGRAEHDQPLGYYLFLNDPPLITLGEDQMKAVAVELERFLGSDWRHFFGTVAFSPLQRAVQSTLLLFGNVAADASDVLFREQDVAFLPLPALRPMNQHFPCCSGTDDPKKIDGVFQNLELFFEAHLKDGWNSEGAAKMRTAAVVNGEVMKALGELWADDDPRDILLIGHGDALRAVFGGDKFAWGNMGKCMFEDGILKKCEKVFPIEKKEKIEEKKAMGKKENSLEKQREKTKSDNE